MAAQPLPGTNTAFPAITTPLEMQAPGGPVGQGPAPPWYQLLRAFWVRTGSQQGINGAALTQASADQALLIALNRSLLNAPVPAASNVPVVITIGASPFAYTAPANGTVVFNAGTVSAITLTRGSNPAVAYPIGVVPVAAGDVVTVTYSVAPTSMDFVPT